jgi:hypothetical protein
MTGEEISSKPKIAMRRSMWSFPSMADGERLASPGKLNQAFGALVMPLDRPMESREPKRT